MFQGKLIVRKTNFYFDFLKEDLVMSVHTNVLNLHYSF